MTLLSRTVFTTLALIALPAAADFLAAPQTRELHQRLSSQYGFTADDLSQVDAALSQAVEQPQLIQAERGNKEATTPFWDDYRKLHIFPQQISNGVSVLRDYAPYFERAEAEYGVPPPVVAAIMGVETKYGRFVGKNRVLDALATQGYHHPTRARFFFGELAAFFAFCRDFGYPATDVRGSYAGAVGVAQFMPSNYLSLARDYDGDGRIDLWTIPDAIGSIAQYFNRYLPPDRPASHWRRGEPLLVPVEVPELAADAPAVNVRSANATIAAWTKAGVSPAVELPADTPAGLIKLSRPDRDEYWLALPNFYSVMSYNPRVYYAMAVTQLAVELQTAQAAQATAVTP